MTDSHVARLGPVGEFLSLEELERRLTAEEAMQRFTMIFKAPPLPPPPSPSCAATSY
jgi:hypothetical protein